MKLVARLHFLHRAWRYRLRSEKFGLSFLLNRDLQGGVAVDIGANRGLFSYWMHRAVGPEGRVIAFEPQPELIAQLKQLREAFRLSRLELVQAGLSSQPGQLTLRRPRSNWGGASFEAPARSSDEADLIPVEVTTLDAFFQHHSARPIRFIKCDVEGHEHAVFLGGRRILTQDRPDLLFECHQAADPDCPVFAYLRSLGYEGYCFVRNGLAPVAEYAALRERMHKRALVDFVFVARESASPDTSAPQ